jgi:hypothetical protein
MSARPNLQKCSHCGGNLGAQDLAGDNCPFCGTVLPHRARAAQQVAVVQGLLADHNGNGIPDAFEGMIAAPMNGPMNGPVNGAIHGFGGAGAPQVVATYSSVTYTSSATGVPSHAMPALVAFGGPAVTPLVAQPQTSQRAASRLLWGLALLGVGAALAIVLIGVLYFVF